MSTSASAFPRHNFLWKLVYHPIRLWLRMKFNYRPKIRPVAGPALIVSNHCMDLDPLLLAVTIKNHAYFIASEHVFKSPGIAKLLLWAQAPIARLKSTTAADTALTALRRMRRGHSVALFPEGNRTFNGVTGGIVESTAKLARASGASLVTHRFRGGYLTTPRWAGNNLHKGLITGEVVNVYPPEQLKTMTPAQIADVIRRDIWEDAYATQAEWRIPYRGKNRAEYIERALYLCPSCGRMGTLRSQGDRAECTCGLAFTYTELGYLEGDDALPFATVTDWDRWQAAELQKRVDAAGDGCIAADTDVTLLEILGGFRKRTAGAGSIAFYRDRLECGGTVFPLEAIHDMSINGPQMLIFTVGSRYYTVASDQVRNLRKYVTIYHALTAPEKILDI